MTNIKIFYMLNHFKIRKLNVLLVNMSENFVKMSLFSKTNKKWGEK